MSSILNAISKIVSANAIQLVCNFLVTIQLARVFSSTELGEYFYLLMVSSVFGAVADFGFTTSFVRKYCNTRFTDGIDGFFVLITQGGIWLFLSLSAFLFEARIVSALNISFVDDCLLIVSLSISEYFIFSSFAGLQAFQKISLYSVLRLLHSLLFLVCVSVLIMQSWCTAESVLYTKALLNVLFVFFLVLVSLWIYARAKKYSLINLNSVAQDFVSLYKFGYSLGLNNIFTVVFSRVDTVLVESLVGYEGVGILELAKRIPLAIKKLFESIRVVLVSRMSQHFFAKEYVKIELILKRASALIVVSGGLMSVVCYLFGCDVMTLLFGNNFIESCAPFIVLCVILPVSFVSNIYGTSTVVLGKPAYPVCVNVVMALLTVVLNLSMIPIYGVAGAAVAVSLATIGVFPLNYILLSKMGIVKIPLLPILIYSGGCICLFSTML